MPLKPLKSYAASYPAMGSRLLRDLIIAVSMGSTLGGCGAVVDSSTIDSALESGLDADACDGDQADCGAREL